MSTALNYLSVLIVFFYFAYDLWKAGRPYFKTRKSFLTNYFGFVVVSGIILTSWAVSVQDAINSSVKFFDEMGFGFLGYFFVMLSYAISYNLAKYKWLKNNEKVKADETTKIHIYHFIYSFYGIVGMSVFTLITSWIANI